LWAEQDYGLVGLLYIYIYMHVYIYIYIYVCVNVVYVYIDVHRWEEAWWDEQDYGLVGLLSRRASYTWEALLTCMYIHTYIYIDTQMHVYRGCPGVQAVSRYWAA
jgi:hypothetical protein